MIKDYTTPLKGDAINMKTTEPEFVEYRMEGCVEMEYKVK